MTNFFNLFPEIKRSFEAANQKDSQPSKQIMDFAKEGSIENLHHLRMDTEWGVEDAKVISEGGRESDFGGVRRTQYTINQELQGTDLNDMIIINPQEIRAGYDQTHYQIDVYAHGGDDIIVNNHIQSGVNNSGHTMRLSVWGGEGRDTFISRDPGSMMTVWDMQPFEQFIVSPEHVNAGFSRDAQGQETNTFFISCDGLSSAGNGHQIYVADGYTMFGQMRRLDNGLEMVYTMVPE